MASTSLAPGFVRLTYDGVLFPHHMTIPVNFDGTPTPGSEPDIVLKGLSTVNVEAALDAFLDVLTPQFAAGTNFGNAEAHAVDETTGDDTFLWTWNAARVGSGGGSNIATTQAVYSFKSSVGSAIKIYLMEGNSPANVKILPPFAPGAIADISDYVVSLGSMVYGRGNAYALAPVSFITKYNDKLRKQQGLA
jgi:hypothetical protein